MSKDEAIKLAIEWIKSQPEETTASKYDVNSRYVVLKELEAALTQEQGEPVALKKGECWPEEVMRQWDYWRKEIANGHKGSAPRDWFEGLSELKLIDTTPQPKREPLPDEEIRKAKHHMVDGAYQYSFMQGVRYAEAAHGIKE